MVEMARWLERSVGVGGRGGGFESSSTFPIVCGVKEGGKAPCSRLCCIKERQSPSLPFVCVVERKRSLPPLRQSLEGVVWRRDIDSNYCM